MRGAPDALLSLRPSRPPPPPSPCPPPPPPLPPPRAAFSARASNHTSQVCAARTQDQLNGRTAQDSNHTHTSPGSGETKDQGKDARMRTEGAARQLEATNSERESKERQADQGKEGPGHRKQNSEVVRCTVNGSRWVAGEHVRSQKRDAVKRRNRHRKKRLISVQTSERGAARKRS